MIFMIREEGKKREWLALSVIYCLSQGMLLFTTGRWWDDWSLYNESKEALRNFASQMGRPSFYYVINFTKFLPEAGRRMITFLAFYFCMIFLYKILRKWIGADSKACFWICALYAVIPVNDIRILQGSIPYALGLAAFMGGFSQLSGLLYDNKMNWKRRVGNLALFFFSFTLNSNLCFYAVVLLMILMHEKSIKSFFRYADYIVLPIVFFIMKSQFFPVWGIYANYNIVTFPKLLKALKYIFPADMHLLLSVAYNWLKIGKRPVIMIGMVTVILYMAVHCKSWWKLFTLPGDSPENKEDGSSCDKKAKMEEMKKILWMLPLGMIILSAGLFSYITIRQSGSVATAGIDGRDAILAGFGAAMVIYSVGMMLFHRKAAYCLFTAMILCGIVHFNLYYLSYQEDHYRQLGFQYQLKQHEELAEMRNLIYLNSDPGKINIKHFYHLNGNGAKAYGNESRFIMDGFGDASKYLQSDSLNYFVESDNYHMSEYDRSHKRIDAVLEYSFDSNVTDVVKMKFYELFDRKRFEKCLQEKSSMNVMLDGTEEYEAALLKAGYENIN